MFWSISFVNEWWPRMTLRSVMRFREYSIRSDHHDVGCYIALVVRPFRADPTFAQTSRLDLAQ
jgi:hypothetical protein